VDTPLAVRRDCRQSWSSSRRRRPLWSCRGGPTWWLSSRSVVVIVFASWLSVILLSMGGGLGALAAIVSLGVVKQEGQSDGKGDKPISISGIQHDHMASEFQRTCA
jgi:hypothetical protein